MSERMYDITARSATTGHECLRLVIADNLDAALQWANKMIDEGGFFLDEVVPPADAEVVSVVFAGYDEFNEEDE